MLFGVHSPVDVCSVSEPPGCVEMENGVVPCAAWKDSSLAEYSSSHSNQTITGIDQ